MVCYNWRYFSPNVGNWSTRDPLGEQSILSQYTYANNNPTMLTDVLGLHTEGEDVAYIFLNGGIDAANLYTYLTRKYIVDSIHVVSKEYYFEPNIMCEKCISQLTVYAHGIVMDGDAYLYIGDETLCEKSDGSVKEISQFFINEDINFCKKATLNIRSCNIGRLDSIKEEIEKHYAKQGKELNVNVYSYYIFPSGFPNFAVYVQIGAIKVLDAVGKCTRRIFE